MPSDPHRWSLLQRLKWRQLGLLAALWFAGAVVASAFIMHETNEMFDNAMAETANAVLTFGVASEPDAVADAARLERLVLPGDRRKYMTFQIRNAEGAVVRRSMKAPAEAYPIAMQNGYVSVGATRYLTRQSPSGTDFAQIAEYHDERRDALIGLLAGFLLPLLALMALGGLLLSRGVALVGQPISELGRQMQARSGANMSLIGPAGVPIELEPIVDDVNRLLSRLNAAFESERAFSSNCAHELRNPIAAARGQIDYIAMFPDDPGNEQRIATVAASLSGLGQRIERLMQLSRAEAGVSVSTGSSDLIAIAQLLVDDYVKRGKPVNFDTGGRSTLSVAMDEDAVGIAVQNLIDNALTNASPVGTVDVTIAPDGTLRVINDCDVIAPADLAGLTQRFKRNRLSKTGGFGLGLAIVGELVQHSGGRIDLRSPADGRTRGFQADLSLPGTPAMATA